MEIVTQRAARRRRVALSARSVRWAAVLVLAPVVLLVVVPTMLGLERYVATSDAMGEALRPGTLLLERRVPASDIRVGDLVTVPRPGAREAGELVTHRVVELEPGAVRTQADLAAQPDPWVVSTRAHPTLARVEVAVPYVALPLLVDVGSPLWAGLSVLAALALAALGMVRTAPRGSGPGRPRRPTRTDGPSRPGRPVAPAALAGPHRP